MSSIGGYFCQSLAGLFIQSIAGMRGCALPPCIPDQSPRGTCCISGTGSSRVCYEGFTSAWCGRVSGQFNGSAFCNTGQCGDPVLTGRCSGGTCGPQFGGCTNAVTRSACSQCGGGYGGDRSACNVPQGGGNPGCPDQIYTDARGVCCRGGCGTANCSFAAACLCGSGCIYYTQCIPVFVPSNPGTFLSSSPANTNCNIGACCSPLGVCTQVVQTSCPSPSVWHGQGSDCKVVKCNSSCCFGCDCISNIPRNVCSTLAGTWTLNKDCSQVACA